MSCHAPLRAVSACALLLLALVCLYLFVPGVSMVFDPVIVLFVFVPLVEHVAEPSL